MSRRFEIVQTYAALRAYQQMFSAKTDGIELLILGRPGLGKTRVLAGSLGTPGIDFAHIRGNQTAFELYRKLYTARDLPILLDDVDDAMTDPKKKNLLKEAMESDACKTISWGSASDKLMDDQGDPIPKSPPPSLFHCSRASTENLTLSARLKVD